MHFSQWNVYLCCFILHMFNVGSGISASGCYSSKNNELFARLSSKLTNIAIGLGETYSLLKNISNSDEGQQRDCLALLETGCKKSGVYNITVTGTDRTSVWCDMETDGGGWTVFQRRIDGATDFYRGWDEYKDGFGDVSHEFWLGNEVIHRLTSSGDSELRVDLEDFEYNTTYAQYQNFTIGISTDGYRLYISGYSGNAGDSLNYLKGYPFSTHDWDKNKCAVRYQGAWWYQNCYYSNLNGLYLPANEEQGIKWNTWKRHSSLKESKMMIRRVTTP